MSVDPRQFLPLRPVEYLVLLALVEQDQHGYGLVKEIAERTEGVVQLAPGNLYRVIKRLAADGLVEPAERRAVPELEDERRLYYSLTRLGARVAALEGQRLHALLASRPARLLHRTLGPA